MKLIHTAQLLLLITTTTAGVVAGANGHITEALAWIAVLIMLAGQAHLERQLEIQELKNIWLTINTDYLCDVILDKAERGELS